MLYSIVRFVPDSVTGEFYNIGVVITENDSATFKMLNFPRLDAARTWRKELYVAVLTLIEEGYLEREIRNSDDLMRMAESKGLIQFSRPCPVVDGKIYVLYDEFVQKAVD